MSRSISSRSRTVAVAATALALGAAGLAGASTATAKPDAGPALSAGSYIVLLDEPAAATYAGGIDGLDATRAAKGNRFQSRSAATRSYTAFLRGRQSDVARLVGAAPLQRYTFANNGFSARLTGQQATELSRTSGVLAVVKDRLEKPDTTSSPEFLGLTKNGSPAAPWSTSAGKGVVVGVIDSGYWPENPSFAGASLPTASSVSSGSPGPVALPAAASSKSVQTRFFKADGGTFAGRCEGGQDFPVTTCNSKVIAADAFSAGFRSQVKPGGWAATEYDSPRDGGGHGSHTASTAAGNSGVDVTIDGVGFGKASGMAPGAKIAVYKVCWEAKNPDQTGCYNSDTAAAIDQAVADGVDVINYSISGSLSDVVDPVEIGYLNAAAAGIFVATSAGNSGPGASTVAHNSPWLTTVAASTHVTYEGTAFLPGGVLVKGASTTVRSDLTGTLVKSADSGTGDDALCAPGTLNPVLITGKIVQCDRGVYDRVAKSAEVKRAGGIGMILTNVVAGSLDADLHSVPTIHVEHTDRAAVLAAVGQQVTLKNGNLTASPTYVPQTAGFSSRGPASAAGGDLLKPDVSAPGVSVIAAVAPPSNSGRSWDFYSGTSMASPHIAGLGAYYLSLHPNWSPMSVKSAMMTTAYNTKNADGSANTDPFGQGAGHVDPTKFLNPGVVFDSDRADWFAYLKGQGVSTSGMPASAQPIDASDLNVPSLAIGDLAGAQTVTRELTDVSGSKEAYQATYSGSGAISVAFDKARYAVPAGGTLPVHMTVTATGTSYGSYATGFITFTGDKGHVVRIPVAVKPLLAKAPTEVTGALPSGSVTFGGVSGFTGTLGTQVTGLVGAAPLAGSVSSGGVQTSQVSVPAGTSFVRFDLDAANDGDDLDLGVFLKKADGTLTEVGTAATGAADERLDLADPTAGDYVLEVTGFALAKGSGGAFATYTLPVPSTSSGNLAVTPATQSVTRTQPFSVTASWSGLDTAKRWLGRVEYLQDGSRTGVYTNVALR